MFYVTSSTCAVLDKATDLPTAIESAKAYVDGHVGRYAYIHSDNLTELDHVVIVSHHHVHNVTQTVVVGA